jgi:hypothetical protein
VIVCSLRRSFGDVSADHRVRRIPDLNWNPRPYLSPYLMTICLLSPGALVAWSPEAVCQPLLQPLILWRRPHHRYCRIAADSILTLQAADMFNLRRYDVLLNRSNCRCIASRSTCSARRASHTFRPALKV